jgi:hypothetical protein
MSFDDRQRLYDFTQRLRVFVEKGLWDQQRELEQTLFDDLLTLWSLQAGRFETLGGLLLGDQRVSVASQSQQSWEEIDQALADVGLTKQELLIKLRLFDSAVDAYEETERGQPTKFAAALKTADVALGSLVTVFSVAEPIKEAKEAIEAVFDWGSGFLRRWRRRRR